MHTLLFKHDKKKIFTSFFVIVYKINSIFFDGTHSHTHTIVFKQTTKSRNLFFFWPTWFQYWGIPILVLYIFVVFSFFSLSFWFLLLLIFCLTVSDETKNNQTLIWFSIKFVFSYVSLDHVKSLSCFSQSYLLFLVILVILDKFIIRINL